MTNILRSGPVTNGKVDKESGCDTGLGIMLHLPMRSLISSTKGIITAANDTYVAAASIGAASGSSTTFAAQPDWGRPLTLTTASLSGNVFTISVYGKDQYGNPRKWSKSATGVITGEAFDDATPCRVLDGYEWTCSGTTGGGRTFSLGMSAVLALPARVAASSDVLYVYEESGGAIDTTYTVNTQYSSITTASAPNGTRHWTVMLQSSYGTLWPS